MRRNLSRAFETTEQEKIVMTMKRKSQQQVEEKKWSEWKDSRRKK